MKNLLEHFVLFKPYKLFHLSVLMITVINHTGR